MADKDKIDICWCGVAFGKPGHPAPHHRAESDRDRDRDRTAHIPPLKVPPPAPHAPPPPPPAAHVTPPPVAPPPVDHHSSHTHHAGDDDGCCANTVDVHVHVTTGPACPPGTVATGPGSTGPGGTGGPGQPPGTRGGLPRPCRPGEGTGDPSGKIPDPPPGMPRNPWDIIQTVIKATQGSTPPPRKDSYLPYLVVRSNPADRGQRPLDGVFWESPDIFVLPGQGIAGAPAAPSQLGGMAQANAPNILFAHVWNLGRAPAFDVRVEFYWFNPTLGIEDSDAHFIGHTYVTLGARHSGKSHRLVRCPVEWVPQFVNNGHECLVVRAFAPLSDPLGPNHFSAKLNRHIAQRNIAVVRASQGAQPVNINVAPGHSTHDARVVSVGVDPAHVPWMQLLTGKRNPGYRAPATAPIAGLTPPAAVLDPSSPRPNFAGLSPQALSQVLSSQHRFQRSTDPLQVTLVTAAPTLAADEAHVVRVQQIHETDLVGGYTTIVLP